MKKTKRLMAGWLLCACSLPALAQSVCTPFGNPPRPAYNGVTDMTNALNTCRDGALLPGFKDASGATRKACFWDNPTATTTQPLPLVVFLQASLAPLEQQMPKTGLVDKRLTADLNGNPQRPGYLLLAPMPRYTQHYYGIGNRYSLGWDVWYRQFAAGGTARVVSGVSYPANVDFTSIDRHIQSIVASGRVDRRRIYLVGYSNGASAAIEYVQQRPEIAAATVYSGPDPYAFLIDPCQQTPVRGEPLGPHQLRIARPDAPIYHVQNSCDIYATCPNAARLQDRLTQSATASIATVTLDAQWQRTYACEAACGTDPNGATTNINANLRGNLKHNRWPETWTDTMLRYLRDHPLP